MFARDGQWRPSAGVCAVLLVGLLAVAVPTASAAYCYMYFDEPRPLGLDTTRVAVQHDGTLDAAALRARLTEAGLDATKLGSVGVPHWTMAATPAAARDSAAIELLVGTLAGAADWAFVSPVFIDDRGQPLLITQDLLVGFDDGVPADAAEKLLGEYVPGGVIEERDFGGLPGTYRVRSGSKDGFEVLAQANVLAALPGVRFAESDAIMRAELLLIPNDPMFSQQWALNQANDQDLDAPEAWDLTTGDASVVVVVMDAGIQQDHPDIHQIPGQDFSGHGTAGGGPYNNCDNHGTCVAGCVSATINNSIGIVGVAPGCVSRSAKIGTGIEIFGWCTPFIDMQPSYLVNAINWSQTVGARVTNSSFGLSADASITTAYNNTRAAGVLHFAATGNDGASSISYPASLASVCAVGALNSSGSLASFSNYGTGIDFCAPGESILLTDRTGSQGYSDGDYTTQNGTSFSSPYAAGVAALVIARNPSLTADQVVQIMKDTCVDLGTAGYDTTYGWGFLNAYAAVQAAAPATGACCYADGSCSDTTQAACTGSWQGSGTDCDPNPCPQPQGACCFADGSCTYVTEASCAGTWQGMGTDCDPNPCPQPWCLGDMDCSGGAPTFDDIKYFSVAVGSESGWWAYYRDHNAGADPPCPWLLGDYSTPRDGVDFNDIKPFAGSLGGVCQTFVP